MGKKKGRSKSARGATAASRPLSTHVDRLTSQTPPARTKDKPGPRPLPTTPSLPDEKVKPNAAPTADNNKQSYVQSTSTGLKSTDSKTSQNLKTLGISSNTQTRRSSQKQNLSPLSSLTRLEVKEHLDNPRKQFAFLEDIKRYRGEGVRKRLEGEGVTVVGPR